MRRSVEYRYTPLVLHPVGTCAGWLRPRPRPALRRALRREGSSVKGARGGLGPRYRMDGCRNWRAPFRVKSGLLCKLPLVGFGFQAAMVWVGSPPWAG